MSTLDDESVTEGPDRESVAWFARIGRVATTLPPEARERFIATAHGIWRLKGQVDVLVGQARARILETVVLAIRCGKVLALREATVTFTLELVLEAFGGDEKAAHAFMDSKNTEQGH
jgi:hypothetical protein